MDYVRVPHDVSTVEICRDAFHLAPSMYRRVVIPTTATDLVRSLLDAEQPFDRGIEPGSRWYMRRSPYYLLRTRALQEHSYTPYPLGEAVTPINSRVFVDFGLRRGDILLSKDSNVGECAIVDGQRWESYAFSSGIVRLRPVCDKWYFFSFLKHPIFKAQLQAMTPRASTISHSRDLWLDCLMPFPNQEDADRVVQYVSALTEAIVDKERAICEKDDRINTEMGSELNRNQRADSAFLYTLPSVSELRALSRLDTGMYTFEFKEKCHSVTSYVGGATNYRGLGYDDLRGQNLQVSAIGKSIYSDVEKAGFYRLLLPTYITDAGVVSRYQWLGNGRQLDLIREGDIVFGAEATFRCAVVCDALDHPTVSNIHAVILRSDSIPLHQKVFTGAWLRFLQKWGFLRAVAVGGQGGSLALTYFDAVPFPLFPDQKQWEIARLYHSPAPRPSDSPTLDTFVEWHRRWNLELGIWELDREKKALQKVLRHVQEQIIEGRTVELPVWMFRKQDNENG